MVEREMGMGGMGMPMGGMGMGMGGMGMGVGRINETVIIENNQPPMMYPVGHPHHRPQVVIQN